MVKEIMSDLEEKVRNYIQKYNMISEKDKIIVGVSGGPDSICLLLLLKELKNDVFAVHINHQIRGDLADRDEKFVEDFCQAQKIPFSTYHIDVPAYAKKKGLSEEEAGREVRRAAFENEMRKYGATKIALAHHMNDNAETLFLNLSRGTGIHGMAGIRPVRGAYIRPLLCLKRTEIEKWLHDQKIPYCLDHTNEEDVYTRNKIRRHVIPYIEENINAKVVEHLQNLSEQIIELETYINRQTELLWEKSVKQEGDAWILNIREFLGADPALRPGLIKKLLTRVSGKEKDIESSHLRAVENLAHLQSGKKISLPYGMQAVRRYDYIWVENKSMKETKRSVQVHMRIFESEGMPGTFPESPYTKWFDYDIIKNNVEIRKRHSGDYITIDRNGNKQKLKKYFVNEKIPENQRDHVLLAADGQHIMWVVGYRQNQHYQVSEHTKRILEIKIIGGEKNGRTD